MANVKQNFDVLDALLKSVAPLEKTAAEVKKDGEGTQAVPKEEVIKDPVAAQGAAGKAGTEAATAGNPQAAAKARDTKEGENVAEKDTNMSPERLTAEQHPAGVTVKKETIGMTKQADRTERLGRMILSKVAEAQAAVEQPAAPAPAEGMDKTAAEVVQASAETFAAYMQAGIEAGMNDVAELCKTAEANPEFAAFLESVGGPGVLLEKIAEEDLSAVVPDELAPAVQDEMGADESEQVLGAVAQQMEELGITPEELAQYLQQIDQLHEEGYSDDEILQSLIELAQEEEGAQPGEAAAAPAEGEVPPPPPPEEKTAEQVQADARARIDSLKARIAGK